MESIIILDSDDEEPTTKDPVVKTPVIASSRTIKRKHSDFPADPEQNGKKKRRVKPKKIGDLAAQSTSSDLNGNDIAGMDRAFDLSLEEDGLPEINLLLPPSPAQSPKKSKEVNKNGQNESLKGQKEKEIIMNDTFRAFLKACKKADPEDPQTMEHIIEKRLVSYYSQCHEDFVNSKGFVAIVKRATERLVKKLDPTPYITIQEVVQELNIRRKSRQAVVTNDVVNIDADPALSDRIDKLNNALWKLKKKITMLEESEVDLNNSDDEYTPFVSVQRYKKRALEIYNKICDLTGESKSACRIVKNPIKFKETQYEAFNRMLENLVNKAHDFPDYLSVLKTLDYCDKNNNWRLRKEEKETIAQTAFLKLGKTLQKRRKLELYETVQFFVGSSSVQPEKTDPELNRKLEENKKTGKNINELIDQYAEKQDNQHANGGDVEMSEEEPKPKKSRSNVREKSKSPKQEPTPSTSKSPEVPFVIEKVETISQLAMDDSEPSELLLQEINSHEHLQVSSLVNIVSGSVSNIREKIANCAVDDDDDLIFVS